MDYDDTFLPVVNQEHSQEINEIAEAMAKAQGQLEDAIKDAKNPFFNSMYTDLKSCWHACRKALSENNIAVIQPALVTEIGAGCNTWLVHKSGQWFKGVLILPYPEKTYKKPDRSIVFTGKPDNGAQSCGSLITYSRRYSLTSMVGISQQDDDGEKASGREHKESKGKPEVEMPKEQPVGKISKDDGLELLAVAKKNGWDKEDVKEYGKTLGYTKLSDISTADFSTFMDYFGNTKKEDKVE